MHEERRRRNRKRQVAWLPTLALSMSRLSTGWFASKRPQETRRPWNRLRLENVKKNGRRITARRLQMPAPLANPFLSKLPTE